MRIAIVMALCVLGAGVAESGPKPEAKPKDAKPREKKELTKLCDETKVQSSDACTKLATLYMKEEDPASDAAASTRALEAMCDAGRTIGCEFAAERHAIGSGAKVSRIDAALWWSKGCDLGDVDLCMHAGLTLHVEGKTDADRVLETRVLKKACDAGKKEGCGGLKLACDTGNKAACGELRLSCDAGNKAACRAIGVARRRH